ncbi:ADP-ribosylglycohydrolase [Pseudogulbenkiania sp. NH8B]|uniref:ADP-ribosylglycohydrolase family protein n=1 Tax=Pseudogulbenkiania sp. (strain NH8B) TaxID=748280 RepID=UPI0002279B92|nr:ADP-ribosylglycohydrolase family protein [Pseudogulbenkiania sp. NH8B]BAK75887.1 ADP-ribosylglycohydrolase [Pseudogulbenkiania sp. NH8B]
MATQAGFTTTPAQLPRIPADPIKRSHFRGSLLGGAVGDALGAQVEFMSLAEIRRKFGEDGIRDYVPCYGRFGAITDDTQMTLFTAEGLLRAYVRAATKGLCHPPSVVRYAYLRWLHTQGVVHPAQSHCLDGWLIGHPELFSRRAPGQTCLSALQQSTGCEAKNSSKGCGGVMRVAPVGMLAASLWDVRSEPQQLARAFELGVETAAITHGHPTGQLPAGVFAAMVALILMGVFLREAVEQVKQLLVQQADHGETLSAIEHAIALAEQDGVGGANYQSLATLGEGWVAEEALAISLYCALTAHSFEEGVTFAVNHGGDSDSTGAITGNLLGAMLGVEAIPERWLKPLELSDVITAMADDLATVGEWLLDDDDSLLESDFYWKRYPGG